MSTQRMIEFETASEEDATRANVALVSALGALAKEVPDGVSLTYWRMRSGGRFLALVELANEGSNPLMDIDATRVLPSVIANGVDGGYPNLNVVEKVGFYGWDR